MKIFITGGSGYLGRNIIRALVKRGDTVHALARSVASGELVEGLGAEVIAGDLHDADALRQGIDGCDVVIHSAALVAQWGDPLDFHRVNVAGTQQVIEACKAMTVPRLIHISTEAVLADGNPIIHADETTPYPHKPMGLYPLTKGLAEKKVLAANSDSLKTIALRPRLIWGKDDTVFLPQLLDAAAAKGGWVWFNHGHYLTATCHVENVVEGVLLALSKGEGGNAYFLTDGAPIEFRNFITEMFKTQGKTLRDRSIPHRLSKWGAYISEFIVRRFNLEIDPPLTRMIIAVISQEITVNDQKARDELGYQGKLSREQGMADLAQRAMNNT
jgi:nucleoside-diphosphate-sugar epimerase